MMNVGYRGISLGIAQIQRTLSSSVLRYQELNFKIALLRFVITSTNSKVERQLRI